MTIKSWHWDKYGLIVESNQGDYLSVEEFVNYVNGLEREVDHRIPAAPDAVSEFIDLADQAVAIRDSDASWETKFHLIFSADIARAIYDTGMHFNYYDPDTSYEEDTLAFVQAAQEKANELRNITWGGY